MCEAVLLSQRRCEPANCEVEAPAAIHEGITFSRAVARALEVEMQLEDASVKDAAEAMFFLRERRRETVGEAV